MMIWIVAAVCLVLGAAIGATSLVVWWLRLVARLDAEQLALAVSAQREKMALLGTRLERAIDEIKRDVAKLREKVGI